MVVPIPTLPPARTVKSEEVAVGDEDAMAKRVGLYVALLSAPMVKRAYGEEVPIPTFTALAPMPPSVRQFEQPTLALYPMAVILESPVVEATPPKRDAWKPMKVVKLSTTDRSS